jgi:hypothetical protein
MDWEQLLKTLMAAIGGNYIDQSNAKQSVSGLDALTGSEAKGVYGSQNRTSDMKDLFNTTMSGANQNPMLTSALSNLQGRANMSAQPPQINHTLRNNLTAPNPLIPSLINTAQNPAGGQRRQQGIQMLMDRISQRMGTRNMNTGTLTPNGL